MTQEEIDKELMELIPKEDLTEEEFNEAKRIWESEVYFAIDHSMYSEDER